ncbi:hypothetical protein WA158_006182 [Blastocystis sp. Blastoise]
MSTHLFSIPELILSLSFSISLYNYEHKDINGYIYYQTLLLKNISEYNIKHSRNYVTVYKYLKQNINSVINDSISETQLSSLIHILNENQYTTTLKYSQLFIDLSTFRTILKDCLAISVEDIQSNDLYISFLKQAQVLLSNKDIYSDIYSYIFSSLLTVLSCHVPVTMFSLMNSITDSTIIFNKKQFIQLEEIFVKYMLSFIDL